MALGWFAHLAGDRAVAWSAGSEPADVVVTMGCGDTCPVVPGTRYEDWAVADPAGLGVDAVRPIRDAIERRVRILLSDLGVTPVA